MPERGHPETFRATDELGQLGNLNDKLIEVRDSGEDESRSVDLGHEVFQIFAIASEPKQGERRKDDPL